MNFAPNRYEKSLKNGVTNQEKNKGLLESLLNGLDVNLSVVGLNLNLLFKI